MRAVAPAVLLAALALTGCTPPIAPAEPFGEFRVTRSGGVAGVDDVLRVHPDGVALVLGPTPRAGRLSPDRMAHARRVLESEELRREAAAPVEEDEGCVDTFVTEVEMGALRVSVPGTCRTGRQRDTPAFDELLEVVAEARRGSFDSGLAPGDAPALTVRVDQPARGTAAAYRVTLDPAGRLTTVRPGEPSSRVDLEQTERDAFAVVAAGLLGSAPRTCSAPTSPVVEVVDEDGGEVRGSACGFGARSGDAHALAGALVRAAGRR